MEKRVSLTTWKNWLLVIVFMGVYFVPRIVDLGTYATADEPLYIRSSASYYLLIREGRFDETDVIIHPGVLNLWAGAAGFFVVFPEYADHAKAGYPLPDLHFREVFGKSDHTPVEMLAVGRMVTILIQTLVLGAALCFSQRVLGQWPAFIGFMLISFDPFNFANSRILQPDGILAASLLLSVIAFIDYLKNNRKISLVASGIGAGLCWLSKLVGIVLGPMVFLIAVFFWWRYHRGDRRKMMLLLRDLVIWLAVALLIFVALWPVMWVNPLETLFTYFKQSFLMSQDVNSPMFFAGELNPEGEFGIDYFYYYLVAIFNQTTPLVLLGLVFCAAAYFWKRSNTDTNFVLISLLIALVIFLTVMSLSIKKADRYVLFAFILLDLLAGIGYWLLIKRLGSVLTNVSGSFAVLPILVVIGLQAFLVWQVAPYYHSYYNPMWGTADKYFEYSPVGFGEGLDQAAIYLNSKEDMKDKVVYSWYSPVFDFYYNYISEGISIHIYDGQFKKILKADYAVIYISQWQRQSDQKLIQYLVDKQPEYTVEINGFEYVKIYNMNDLRAQTGE